MRLLCHKVKSIISSLFKFTDHNVIYLFVWLHASQHKTVGLYLEHSGVSGQSDMSYTSFAQKPHFLFRNNICCFCVERHCFILQAVYLPSPLRCWTTAYLLEKKLNSCQWFGCLKRVLAFVQGDCSVFASCLRATHNRGMRVFCCSSGFFKLSSLFLAHQLLQ